eukprot:GEMP01031706.1.p1 GENE.GEMP01031706.1~~GEMP01031706.1.p1  ORF type:complete len:368 (+),score=66.57 GEMP01031706.1:126-1229(+)
MAVSATTRRIQKEIGEISRNPSNHWKVMPVDDDMYEWHFTIRGPEDTDFERGRYHGRICLPANYPFAPPSIMLLTPNGRFETNKKICLSVSNFHPELWQPAWGIRTILEALRSFFPTPPEGAVGGLDWPPHVRRQIAAEETAQWRCEVCKATNAEILPNVPPEVTENVESPVLSRALTEVFGVDPAPSRACSADLHSSTSGIPLATVDPFPFRPNSLGAAGTPHPTERNSTYETALLPSDPLSSSELPVQQVQTVLPEQEGQRVPELQQVVLVEQVQPVARVEQVQNQSSSSIGVGESAKATPSSERTEVAPAREVVRDRRSPIMILLPSLPQDRRGAAIMCVDVLILHVLVAFGYFCHSVAIRPPF